MIITDVFVPGNPKTKGSMTARPNGSMRQSVAGSTAWQRLMSKWVSDDIHRRLGPAWPAEPYPGEVSVALVFLLPVAEAIQTRAGDLDKLARNALDALTAVAYVDDNQVIRLTCDKVGTGPEGRKGVFIRVWTGRV